MILKKGGEKHIGSFIVKLKPNNKPFHRWSLVVSRKFSKLATKRNKKRRQIYEAIRNYIKDKGEKAGIKHYDIVLIPKKLIINQDYKTIFNDIAGIHEYLESKKST